MNFFDLHIGDLDSATAHLSLLEDGAYGRLMRLYYRTERPIPADLKQACRLVRAVTKPERDAVGQVLEEFFHLEDDGWHNDRCDAEIAAYQAGEPEREVKKANEENRLKKHREERARLFQIVTAAGEHLIWNVPMADLRAAAARITAGGAPPPAPPAPPLPDTAPATPATATQDPEPRTQDPLPTTQNPEGKGEQGTAAPAPGVTPTAAGGACLALRRAGVPDCNTSHPKLLALLGQGVTSAELSEAAQSLPEGKRKFAYVLATVEGRRRDAAAIGALPAPAARGNRQQALEDSNRAVGQQWAAGAPEEPHGTH